MNNYQQSRPNSPCRGFCRILFLFSMPINIPINIAYTNKQILIFFLSLLLFVRFLFHFNIMYVFS